MIAISTTEPRDPCSAVTAVDLTPHDNLITKERNAPFPSLKLSGELRNRVYDFLATSQNASVCQVLPGLGLCGANRQLRYEYLPICMRQAVTIKWDDLEKYIETFYPCIGGQVQNIDFAPAQLTVLIDDAEVRAFGLEELDVRPLIRMRLSSSKFSCLFKYSTEPAALAPEHGWARDFPSAVDVLNTLVAHRDVDWEKDIAEDRLQEVSVSVDNLIPYIQLAVSSDLFDEHKYEEGCVCEDECEVECRSDALFGYIEEVGLDTALETQIEHISGGLSGFVEAGLVVRR